MNHNVNVSHSRRDFIKTLSTLSMLAVVPQLVAGKGMQSAPRILVAYYSHTGNTKVLGQKIHQIVGGDVFEIEPVTAYSSDNDEAHNQARKEVEEAYKPPLKANVPNIQVYDIIFLGSPNWLGSAARPIVSFIDSHDLAGKTIIPFVTYGGSVGTYFQDLFQLCPSATVLTGFGCKGADIATSEQQIMEWINGLPVK